MNRKLKALGLALFAVLAMGALSASAATAGSFHSESGTHTVIKGSQVGTDVFTLTPGTVTCQEATYAGTQSGATATTVTVTPTYTQCTAFGFVNATIDVNGCTYEFSGDNNNFVIECPGASLTITAFNCWVTMPPQTVTGIVTYANTGAGASRDVDIKIGTSGIHYQQLSKSFPGCTNSTHTNGSYKAEATVQGFNTAGTQVGVWRE